jgi:hypothetical protein
VQNQPANKMARRERYPRAKDAFDRELAAVQEMDEADSLFARSPTDEAAAAKQKAAAALKAARAAYLAACGIDEAEFAEKSASEVRET